MIRNWVCTEIQILELAFNELQTSEDVETVNSILDCIEFSLESQSPADVSVTHLDPLVIYNEVALGIISNFDHSKILNNLEAKFPHNEKFDEFKVNCYILFPGNE